MLIGIASIGVGTILGFTFSKFFFMIVKEIVLVASIATLFIMETICH